MVVADQVKAAIKAWEDQVVQVRHETFEDDMNWPNMMDVQILHLLRAMDSAGPPVTAGTRERLADLKAEWSALEAEYARITTVELAAFTTVLENAGIGGVQIP